MQNDIYRLSLLMRIRRVGGVLYHEKQNKEFIYRSLIERLDYSPSREQLKSAWKAYIHFVWKWCGSMNDFLDSEMYRKSDFVIAESLSRYIRFPWRKALWSEKNQEIFNDKRLFYSSFDKYLGRKWIYVDKNTKAENLASFLKSCSYEFFAKEPLGFGGKQVRHFKKVDNSEISTLLKECENTPLILEEKIVQCNELLAFSNSSVNTIRIVTLVDDKGVAHIASAALRMGTGTSSVDNFSSGGISALIDIDTGIVCSTAKDKYGREYILHPTTQKQILGYRIDDWERYKVFAIQLANEFIDMRYVGWDIVKTEQDMMCVIEGNDAAGVDYLECHTNRGLLPLYEKLVSSEHPANTASFQIKF